MKSSHFIDWINRALKADKPPGDGSGTWWDRSATDAFAGAAAPPPYHVIHGDDKNNKLTGDDDKNDKIFGHGGHDTIDGLGGDDILLGGDDPDDLILGAGNDTYNGGKGRDTIIVPSWTSAVIDLSQTGPQVTHYGTETFLNIENLQGNVGADQFKGNAKNNDIFGRGGDDVIVDHVGGDDHLYGGADNDTLEGGPGIDTMYGGEGDDVLKGGTDSDDMWGDDGEDTLYGGGGNDWLYGGPKKDVILGGGGRDHLFGDGGGDMLDGGPGNDVEKGGRGKDWHWLSPGNDTHNGGPGSDWIGIGGSTGGHVDLSNPHRQDTGFGKDIIRSIENVFGSVGPDRIKGSNGDNELTGFLGPDVIRGGGGNDDINGGPGQDNLWGNGGEDFFVFMSPQDSLVATPDRIRDFLPGEDMIDLTHIDADTTTSGDQAFAWGGQTATAHGVWYDPAAGLLFGDVDGDKVADFAIQLDGAPALDYGDLLN